MGSAMTQQSLLESQLALMTPSQTSNNSHSMKRDGKALASDQQKLQKNEEWKGFLRACAVAADDLFLVTLDQSKEVAEFVTVAKTATAALLKPIGFAKECFANASQVPLYDYQTDDEVEIIGRYKLAIFDLLSLAKQIRSEISSPEELPGPNERQTFELDFRRRAVKTSLWWFGKQIEQVIFSDVWL